MQPAFTDEEACACHKELFEMMGAESAHALKSAFQPRSAGWVLLDQSGEHSRQSRLTHDLRHPYDLSRVATTQVWLAFSAPNR